jgi:hypothetical protein
MIALITHGLGPPAYAVVETTARPPAKRAFGHPTPIKAPAPETVSDLRSRWGTDKEAGVSGVLE